MAILSRRVRRRIVSPLLALFILVAYANIFLVSAPANAQVISEDWKYEIEAYLQEVDANTTAEIVVYIVQTLTGHDVKKDGAEINDIVELGVYIFNEMPLDTPNGPVVGIGKKERDNG